MLLSQHNMYKQASAQNLLFVHQTSKRVKTVFHSMLLNQGNNPLTHTIPWIHHFIYISRLSHTSNSI